MPPLVAFLESLGPMLLATRHQRLRDQWMIKFVLKRNERFISPSLRQCGPVVVVGETAMRWLRMAAGLAQLPVAQQSTLSASYRRNLWKYLISDGLLTEYLVERMGEPVGRFYSMHDVVPENAALVRMTAIIGSNWQEFGCMNQSTYETHLHFLRSRYPDAVYFCHPREISSAPETIFGVDNVRRPNVPVEIHLRDTGIPCLLVGVCSSAMLSIPGGNPQHVAVELIELQSRDFNGPTGDVVQRFSPPLRGLSEITVGDLQNYLEDALEGMGVSVTRVQQP
jgi:hypothetical protein